jgi:hypothetical protein
LYPIFDSGRRRENLPSVSPRLQQKKVCSGFLSAMYFADELALDNTERLIDERLANHRAERHRLLALPIASMADSPCAMRFRYGSRY